MSLRGKGAAIGLMATGLAAAAATPDEILLRNGGRVSGVVVEKTRDAIVVETGPGRVTLSMRLVEKVVEGRSALAAYHERAAALQSGDEEGWAALARWAAERNLLTQSREAWQEVLTADPSHPQANAALGRVEVDGTWMGEAEAYRARGYVSFEGRWVTPAEHEALVRERAAEEASERETREAGLRVREAEARAREAEARAREAETAAQPVNGGIPFGWGWGGGWGGGLVTSPLAPWRLDPQPWVEPMVRPPVHPTRPPHRPPGETTGRPQPSQPSPPSPAKPAGSRIDWPPRDKPHRD